MAEEETKKCPFCAEIIKKEAIVCRFCGYDLKSGKPASHLSSSVPHEPIEEVKAKSGVMDGVKIGVGMFIVLPMIIIGIIVLLVLLVFLVPAGQLPVKHPVLILVIFGPIFGVIYYIILFKKKDDKN